MHERHLTTYKVAWATLVLLLSLAIGLRVVLVKEYVIKDEGATYTIQTLTKDLGRVLDHLGVTLKPYDQVSIPLDQPLKNKQTIHITRAKSYEITIGGHRQHIETVETRVSDILKQAHVIIDAYDRVSPPLSSIVKPGSRIQIEKIEAFNRQTSFTMPYPLVYVIKDKLAYGVKNLLHEGVEGQLKHIWTEYHLNQNWYHSYDQKIEVLNPPTQQVMELGKEPLLVVDSGRPYRIKNVYTMRATAYDLSYASTGKVPGDPAYGITRSGTQARPGVVAVDKRLIPLGTTLYVESLDHMPDYGFSLAEDTGSAIIGKKIDLFIGNTASARRFGVRYVKVYELDEEVDERLIVGYGN